MHVIIDPRPVQPVNHCFTTCTGRTSRTSRVKPFTGRIRSTVLDKDGGIDMHVQLLLLISSICFIIPNFLVATFYLEFRIKLQEGIHFDSSSQGEDSMLTNSPKNYYEASKALRPKNVRYPT